MQHTKVVSLSVFDVTAAVVVVGVNMVSSYLKALCHTIRADCLLIKLHAPTQ